MDAWRWGPSGIFALAVLGTGAGVSDAFALPPEVASGAGSAGWMDGCGFAAGCGGEGAAGFDAGGAGAGDAGLGAGGAEAVEALALDAGDFTGAGAGATVVAGAGD